MMDSAFTDIHWQARKLPIIADDWIGLRLPEEAVAAPEEYNLRQNDDAEIKLKTTKKPKKLKWEHNPMEE